MKLDFHRIGVKLFFVTFAVEGRRPMLSKLVDEKSRPQLLSIGEVVRAALRALHLVRETIGISDYVIMPDHVHFIMRTRFIKLLPCALPPRYDPSSEDSRELAAGRMLILSGFSQTPALSAIEMRKDPTVAHAFRRNCLAMNDLAAALCAAATTGENV